jgi:hypothetical protein
MFSGKVGRAALLAAWTAGAIFAQGTLAITTPAQLLPAQAGVPYSVTFNATGGTPPYTWSFLGSLPLGLQLNNNVLAGTPATNAQSIITIRVADSAGAVTSANFNLSIGNAGTLLRSGVIAQVASGGSWDTTFYVVNTSANINSAQLTFRGDGGGPLNLPFTWTQQGLSQSLSSANTLTFTLNPNTTIVLHTGSTGGLLQGWADVFSTGGISSFAIFKQTLPNGVAAEGTSGQLSQFQPSLVIPYDNSSGNTTSFALVSLANIPINVAATLWDENGNQLGTPNFSLTIYQHIANAIPTIFPATAGKRGTVLFQNVSSTDALSALGLSFSSLIGNSFTSVPVLPAQ